MCVNQSLAQSCHKWQFPCFLVLWSRAEGVDWVTGRASSVWTWSDLPPAPMQIQQQEQEQEGSSEWCGFPGSSPPKAVTTILGQSRHKAYSVS